MSLPKELDANLLQDEYMDWFKSEFGFTPVIASSTGCPAVRFAQHIYQKYAHLACGGEE